MAGVSVIEGVWGSWVGGESVLDDTGEGSAGFGALEVREFRSGCSTVGCRSGRFCILSILGFFLEPVASSVRSIIERLVPPAE